MLIAIPYPTMTFLPLLVAEDPSHGSDRLRLGRYPVIERVGYSPESPKAFRDRKRNHPCF